MFILVCLFVCFVTDADSVQMCLFLAADGVSAAKEQTSVSSVNGAERRQIRVADGEEAETSRGDVTDDKTKEQYESCHCKYTQ